MTWDTMLSELFVSSTPTAESRRIILDLHGNGERMGDIGVQDRHQIVVYRCISLSLCKYFWTFMHVFFANE